MKKKQLSFAERAQEILKRYEERNDPISKRSKEAELIKLQKEQELVRAKMKEAENKRQGLALGSRDGSGPMSQFGEGGEYNPLSGYDKNAAETGERSRALADRVNSDYNEPRELFTIEKDVDFDYDINPDFDLLNKYFEERNLSEERPELKPSKPVVKTDDYERFATGGPYVPFDESLLSGYQRGERTSQLTEMPSREAEMILQTIEPTDPRTMKFRVDSGEGMNNLYTGNKSYGSGVNNDKTKTVDPYAIEKDYSMIPAMAGNMYANLAMKPAKKIVPEKISSNATLSTVNRDAIINNILGNVVDARGNIGRARGNGNFRTNTLINAGLNSQANKAILQGLNMADNTDARSKQVYEASQDKFKAINKAADDKAKYINAMNEKAFKDNKIKMTQAMFNDASAFIKDNYNLKQAELYTKLMKEYGISKAQAKALVLQQTKEDAAMNQNNIPTYTK